MKTPDELKRELAEKYFPIRTIYTATEFYVKIQTETQVKFLSDLNALLDKLMPTEEEIEDKAKKKYTRKEYQDVFIIACRWVRLIMKGKI